MANSNNPAETLAEKVTQSSAPPLTVATIGHPANECYIIKAPSGLWRYVESGRAVEPEDFRAGWDVVSMPPTRNAESEVDDWSCQQYGYHQKATRHTQGECSVRPAQG